MNRDQAKRLAPLFDPLSPADPELYVARPEPPIAALRSAVVSPPTAGADIRIDKGTLDAVAQEASKSLKLRVRESQMEILRRVHETSKRPEGDNSDELLYYNIVLAYPNDPAWFRPSPLLRRYLMEES